MGSSWREPWERVSPFSPSALLTLCRYPEESAPVPSDFARPALRGQDGQRPFLVQNLHLGPPGRPRRFLRQDLFGGRQPLSAREPLLFPGAAGHADEEADVQRAAEPQHLRRVSRRGCQQARLSRAFGHHPEQAWVEGAPRHHPQPPRVQRAPCKHTQQAWVSRKCSRSSFWTRSKRSREHPTQAAGI